MSYLSPFRFALVTALFAVLLALLAGPAVAQTAALEGAPPVTLDEAPGVYLILDASGSMWGQLPDGTNKIVAARRVLGELVEGGGWEGKELALRAYGHNREGDCADTELVVPFTEAAAAAAPIRAFAEGVNPKGKTPITRSLRAALEDFGERPGEVILISDGLETCDADPCELMKEWRQRNVQIRVHVVGLGLEEKEKEVLRCVSEAAGTPFYDAGSVEELAEGLRTIREVTTEPALRIVARSPQGEELVAEGSARGAKAASAVEVRTHARNKVPSGPTSVTVGVRTVNGELFQPVTRETVVAPLGDTLLEVEVPVPPRLSFRFAEDGEEVAGALVRAFALGEEVFTVRPQDEVFVTPAPNGAAYTFRSRVNADNELEVEAKVVPGEDLEVVFELTTTVRAKIRLVASGSGLDYGSNLELWRGGEKVYDVHRVNGVRAAPGTYTLRNPNRLTPYEQEEFVITAEAEQEFVVEVPSGHLTVAYQNADGSAAKDERIFVQRWNGEAWVRDRLRRAGERIPLTPGRYRLEGWNRGGHSYEAQEFNVAAGDELERVLRNTSSE